MDSAPARKASRRLFHAATSAACALLLCACAAATRPAETDRPRADETPYPVILAATDERRARALAGWANVVGAETTQAAAAAPTPELQPVTATMRALPAGLQTTPRLPKVVIENEAEQSEEETRESLRRFIASAAPLLGVEPARVSLVEITDAPATPGARRATYRQNPFAFPLGNGFGVIEITFTPDLRVVGLNSTAVPDEERLRRALDAVARKLTAEQAVASLANRAVTFTDPGGARQTRTLTQSDTIEARQLVVFPSPRAGDPAAATALELRFAWELAVGGGQGPPLLVYVDAITGDQLGATQTP